MTSAAALYPAVVTFLNGDAGDLAAAIVADQGSPLPAGTVIVSKGGRLNPPWLSIEIVPASQSWRQRETPGMGSELLEVVVNLEITVRKKDLKPGKNLLSLAESYARAFVRRYRDMTNLTFAVTGATFIRSEAEFDAIDDIRESNDEARAIVRVAFVFMEDLRDSS